MGKTIEVGNPSSQEILPGKATTFGEAVALCEEFSRMIESEKRFKNVSYAISPPQSDGQRLICVVGHSTEKPEYPDHVQRVLDNSTKTY